MLGARKGGLNSKVSLLHMSQSEFLKDLIVTENKLVKLGHLEPCACCFSLLLIILTVLPPDTKLPPNSILLSLEIFREEETPY